MTSTVTYKATPSEVIDALLSEELAAQRAKLFGGAVTHTRTGSTATTEVTIPVEKLPSKVRGFAKGGAHVTIITRAEGHCVTYTVDPHGLPAEVGAVMALSGDTETTATVTGELKVKIPLIGGKLEKKAASVAERVLAKDAELLEQVVG